MAGTVTTDQTEIHNCDVASDWTGSPDEDSEVYIEGIGSLSKKVSKTTSTHMKSISQTDLSDTVIYVWILGGSIAQFATKANGGIRIRVESGVTPEYGEWYVAGSDQGYAGGWQCLSVRTTQALDNDGGVNLAQANAVGVTFNVPVGANKINCWWDRIAYGTGLTIYAGTSGDPATLANIISAEATNKWGIAAEIEGAIFFQGKLSIGSTSEGQDTYFKDTNKIIIFKDRGFGAFYEIKAQGNATATTQEIYFGENVGGRGVSGFYFKSAGADKFTFDMSDSNILKLGIYGSVFFDAGTITFPAYNANKSILSCSFEACAEILASTSVIEYCNVINADDKGIRIADVAHNITNCNFINCPHCIHVNFSDTVDFEELKFTGSDGSSKYDIEHSVAGALTVTATNSNPNEDYVDETGGGSTSIINTVYLTVTVQKENTDPIQNAQVYIKDASDDTELMNKDTDVDGEAQEAYNYSGAANIVIRVRKSSLGTKYLPVSTIGAIGEGGFSLTVVLKEDIIAQ